MKQMQYIVAVLLFWAPLSPARAQPAQPDTQPDAQPGAQPASQPDLQPGPQPATQPMPGTEVSPDEAGQATPAPESAPAEEAPAAGEPAPEPAGVPEATKEPAPQPPAAGEVPGALRYGLSMLTRYELRRGYDRLGRSAGRFVEGDAAVYRARLKLSSAAVDVGQGRTVTVWLAPQASGFLGAAGNTVADAALGLHEGYVRVQGRSSVADVGRFELNYGDALILGNLDWHQTARSFEGVRARYQPVVGGYYVDGFFTQPVEGRPLGAPLGAGDQYLYGVYAGLGPLVPAVTDLDVYALGLSWPQTDNVPIDPADPAQGTATRAGAMRLTLGTRVKGKSGVVDYRVEAGVQAGSAPGAPGQEAIDVFAYHGDAELGFAGMEGRARAALEGFYASGDDPDTATSEAWDQLFPTAHKWLGLADVFGGRSNVAGFAVHGMVKLGEFWTAKVDGHVFFRPQPAEIGYAGNEIDVQVVRVLGKGLVLRGLYGAFMPDMDVYGREDMAHYLEIELRYDLN